MASDLLPGQSHNGLLLTSPTGAFRLTFNEFGDGLVLRVVDDSKLPVVEYNTVVWARGQVPGANSIIMQTDGNLVIYDFFGDVVWASGSSGHEGENAFLRV